MILCVNTAMPTGSNEGDNPFYVNNADDAIDTIKLMEYLQQFRPEKKVLECIEMDASETSLAIMATMEANHWNHTLHFREQPTRSMQLILNRHPNWNYTVEEVTP